MAHHDGEPYKPTYYRSSAPVVSSVVPDPIRDLIDSRKRGWEGKLGELGARIVQKQLDIHREAQQEAQSRGGAQSSLLDQSAAKIIDSFSGSEEDLNAIATIPAQLARKAIWESERLPYTAFRLLRRALETERSLIPDQIGDFATCDIDEWILANERALRDDPREDWKHGLVDWATHAAAVLPESSVTSNTRAWSRTIMSGYTLLDELRAPTVAALSSIEAFNEAFAKITDGLLKGLDWSNVFIAGGIVLSTLLCVHEDSIKNYINSDIDVYIYGLGPREANEKIKHIFEVWKRNLPDHAKDKTMVVRNSRTITFFSQHPIKRLQIVLKLVKHPKEVLLNFDLDICSMGFDGRSLWLLPRAARSLETGYNVFTMNLIEGHYLGERRASQESRVFKYADKGYGLRILPSYIESLSSFVIEAKPISRYHWKAKMDILPDDLAARADKASKWTHKGIHRYIQHGYGKQGGYSYSPDQRDAEGRLEFTHAMLEERCISSSEPGDRSCLTGFELLMRHVELWREKVRGHIAMSREAWAMNNYDVGPTGYDDSPIYTWDSKFDFVVFEHALEDYNRKDTSAFFDNLDTIAADNEDLQINTSARPYPYFANRISWASDVSDVISSENDNVLLFFVAEGFAQFANEAILEALRDHSLPSEIAPLQVLESVIGPGECHLDAVLWKVDGILAWQQIDRRIDEVNEILWSFYRSHNCLLLPIEDLTRKFFTEVSRRAIRPTPTDEFTSFARWITRIPPPIGYSYGGFGGQGFFGWTDSEGEDEDPWGSTPAFNLT